jgi:hypothetical protein
MTMMILSILSTPVSELDDDTDVELRMMKKKIQNKDDYTDVELDQVRDYIF